MQWEISLSKALKKKKRAAIHRRAWIIPPAFILNSFSSTRFQILAFMSDLQYSSLKGTVVPQEVDPDVTVTFSCSNERLSDFFLEETSRSSCGCEVIDSKQSPGLMRGWYENVPARLRVITASPAHWQTPRCTPSCSGWWIVYHRRFPGLAEVIFHGGEKKGTRRERSNKRIKMEREGSCVITGTSHKKDKIL